MMTTPYLNQFHSILQKPAEGSHDVSESGRKWVFLHGLMGYASNWRKVLSGLGTDSYLAIDQRGHGRSFQPEQGYSAVDYAQDLRKITEELGWNRFVLVGHSMGGRNALAFAHLHPESVEKLIIEDIGPDSAPGAALHYEKMLGLIPTPFSTKESAKRFFSEIWPQISSEYENRLVLGQYLYSNLSEDSQGRMDWRFSKRGIIASVAEGHLKEGWNILRGLTMPTLLIRGQNSKELPQDVFEKMLASNPRIQGVVIPNAGHWVHADQSQEFLRNIQEFANS